MQDVFRKNKHANMAESILNLLGANAAKKHHKTIVKKAILFREKIAITTACKGHRICGSRSHGALEAERSRQAIELASPKNPKKCRLIL